MAGMTGHDALTGQRLLKVLERVDKSFTPSHVSKAQVINTFPYMYIKNSLIYTYISMIAKEWTKQTSLSWFRNGTLYASLELPQHFSFAYFITSTVL